MVEIFRNPKIDWIAAKKYFIGITIALLVAGAISVQVRGFNLGVDFTGGTIMTVRFSEPHRAEEIRSVLDSANLGIDTSKVTIVNDKNNPSDMIIRAPELGTESEHRVDETKRAIIRALQRLNPAGETAAGKVNINTLDADGIEQELRQTDPLGINGVNFAGPNPYRQVGDQVIAFRDGKNKGFIRNIDSLDTLTFSNISMAGSDKTFDEGAIKRALKDLFYADKIDLNLAGVSEIEDALNRIDPLAASGQSAPQDTYRKAAEAIARYRAGGTGVIKSLDDIQIQDVTPDLLNRMRDYFFTGNWAVLSADIVGPQVGADLRNRAIYVTLAALAGMLVYIAFRFEWIYGVAAVLAVFHDVMITMGVFSLVKQEISLTVVAALLTLVGYSMNDTIVVFDRIRENLRLRRRDNLVQIVNDSINQTLSRTIIAAGLTFISVLSILLFGGQVLRGFALALTIGILIGTYSSIAVASPIMMWWQYLTGGASGQGKGMAQRNVKQRAAEPTLAKV
jgi:preprotein translocase SecF subunit